MDIPAHLETDLARSLVGSAACLVAGGTRGSNPEYERALCELIHWQCGATDEDYAIINNLIWKEES